MRVLFTDAVLERPDLWKYLDRILHKVDDGWHWWQVDDPETIEASPWFEGSRSFLRDLLEQAAKVSTWGSTAGPHAILVRVSEARGDKPWNLDARSAAVALEDPLRILVEDTQSDGAFLALVFDLLGHGELRRLRRLTPPALEFDSAGGRDQVPRRLEHYLRDPAWREIPRRILVVIDSDAPRPGTCGDKVREVAAECRQRGVPCHVLRKREIENYLPHEVLEAWASLPENTNARPRVQALARLTPTQYDHFPLKKGFSRGLPDGCGDLYEGVSETDMATFERGFGEKILEKLVAGYREAFSADGLRERCGLPGACTTTELDQLIDLVCRHL